MSEYEVRMTNEGVRKMNLKWLFVLSIIVVVSCSLSSISFAGDASTIYQTRCGVCHNSMGKPINLTDTEGMDAMIAQFGKGLTEEEVSDLSQYIKSMGSSLLSAQDDNQGEADGEAEGDEGTDVMDDGEPEPELTPAQQLQELFAKNHESQHQFELGYAYEKVSDPSETTKEWGNLYSGSLNHHLRNGDRYYIEAKWPGGQDWSGLFRFEVLPVDLKGDLSDLHTKIWFYDDNVPYLLPSRRFSQDYTLRFPGIPLLRDETISWRSTSVNRWVDVKPVNSYELNEWSISKNKNLFGKVTVHPKLKYTVLDNPDTHSGDIKKLFAGLGLHSEISSKLSFKGDFSYANAKADNFAQHEAIFRGKSDLTYRGLFGKKNWALKGYVRSVKVNETPTINTHLDETFERGLMLNYDAKNGYSEWGYARRKFQEQRLLFNNPNFLPLRFSNDFPYNTDLTRDQAIPFWNYESFESLKFWSESRRRFFNGKVSYSSRYDYERIKDSPRSDLVQRDSEPLVPGYLVRSVSHLNIAPWDGFGLYLFNRYEQMKNWYRGQDIHQNYFNGSIYKELPGDQTVTLDIGRFDSSYNFPSINVFGTDATTVGLNYDHTVLDDGLYYRLGAYRTYTTGYDKYREDIAFFGLDFLKWVEGLSLRVDWSNREDDDLPALDQDFVSASIFYNFEF